MDVFDLYQRALNETDRLAALAGPETLDRPTPCAEWKVRDLVRHLIEGNWSRIRAGGGQPPARTAADLKDDELVPVYRASVAELKRLWGQPGMVQGRYGPRQELGANVLQAHLLGRVAHGWDLARGLGVPPAFDDDVVHAALEQAQATLRDEQVRGERFAPPVAPPPAASELDQLAAFLGRQV